MHILMHFSTDIPARDGIASHVMGLSRRLRKRGHKVTILTRGKGHHRREFQYEGFDIVAAPYYPLYPFHVHFHGYFVHRAIKSLSPQPDLIHLHSPLVPPLTKKWPVVTTFHTPMLVDTAYVENVSLRTRLIKLLGKTVSYWIEKKLLKSSDAIITVSDSVADELKTYYGNRNHTYPILNVVDSEFYKPTAHPPDDRKLLYVGRITYRKGLFEIVESAVHVVRKYPDIKYTFVGSGPLEKYLRRAINRHGLQQNFQFCGEIHNPEIILEHYHSARVVLIPSYYEGLPMTLLESMSCGKAIITTNASFSKDILEDGANALLVNPKSVEELTDATFRLLSSPQLCEDLGRAARKTIVEKMNAETNTDKIEEVYSYAIDSFAKAACR